MGDKRKDVKFLAMGGKKKIPKDLMPSRQNLVSRPGVVGFCLLSISFGSFFFFGGSWALWETTGPLQGSTGFLIRKIIDYLLFFFSLLNFKLEFFIYQIIFPNHPTQPSFKNINRHIPILKYHTTYSNPLIR